jgi:hypothetical protein
MEGPMGLFGSSNPVFAMLEKDHAKVKDLFRQFENAKDARARERIVRETLHELDVHTKLEETVIYPALRGKLEEKDLLDEAWEEHHVAHVLINELKRMRPSDDRYDAKFTVLGENIKHHVKEEEHSMFPQAEKADLDWQALERKVKERKAALMENKGNGQARQQRKKTARTARGSRRRHLQRVA